MKRRTAELINRHNWQNTREYLRYYEEVLQNKPRSVDFTRTAVDHLLRWATSTPLSRAPEIRPVFPQYLNDLGKAPEYQRKLLNTARRFFEWARDRWPDRYVLKRQYIDSLRSKAKDTAVPSREIYSLDQVRALLAHCPCNLAEERDRAAVAFLFLSGMRVGAFATLPMCAVHIEQQPVLINQWTALGVRTKNDAVANTVLLDNPELDDLHAVVSAWDTLAREHIGPQGMWYSLIEPDGMNFMLNQTPGRYRGDGIARRLRLLCELAGVPYLSPHKLRHGHIVYAVARCKTMADLKAVSQNVMHKQLSTTDAIYARLTDDDVARRIHDLGKSKMDDAELDELARALFCRLRGVT
ncbi:MAG: tyrosine-type recombinase/integrase [Anaerolineae bacterium]|nr:tyrosine-type recombinase/integrase [Anaerolineae bacterium]